FSIVTCHANPFMAKLHHGAGEMGPRMPLFLHGQDLLHWLDPHRPVDQIQSMIQPDREDGMRSHEVRPLRGKQSVGNDPLACEPWGGDAGQEQLSLFEA
ncbi:MAG: SOS response-associated peptidase family protein, partial [Flavobacteriales bacterium]